MKIDDETTDVLIALADAQQKMAEENAEGKG
jgi:hypothetical protein